MSTRTLRKLFGTTTLPPLEGNSDEEFEPLYAKPRKSNILYAGLEVSDPSDNDAQNAEESDEEVAQEQIKKKKKKNRRRKPKTEKVPSLIDGKELDDIDKSLLEVNALLGAPPSPIKAAPAKKRNHNKELLSVTAKHLDYQNEIRKILNSDIIDPDSKPRRYRPHNVVKYRRGCIVYDPPNIHYPRVGLSMDLVERKGDVMFFTINHSRDYQRVHQSFLNGVENGNDLFTIGDTAKEFHIEALLEYVDFMLRSEEYTGASKMIEQLIGFYQYIAHPSFNLTDQRVRLEYKYLENRPFHVVVLKYLHMLSNRACHRTALELAKLLLNLDPSDPLAIIYMIDTLAIRAREHKWLIELIDFWKVERDAGLMFNMQYSYGLAHYHVATENNSGPGLAKADELIQEAMMHFPTLTSWFIQGAKNKECVQILGHPLFSPTADTGLPDKLKVAYMLHAKLLCWRYREPKVLEWFTRNALSVIKSYEKNVQTRIHIEQLAKQRKVLFSNCPLEIHRHLQVVRAMSSLLVEWELPGLTRQHAWDPVPTKNFVNRYNYGPVEVTTSYYTVLFNLFSSVMPNFVPAEPRGADGYAIADMRDGERQRALLLQRGRDEPEREREERVRARAQRVAAGEQPRPDSSSDSYASDYDSEATAEFEQTPLDRDSTTNAD